MTLVYANIAISWQLLRFNSLKKHFPQIYRFKRFENGLEKKFPDLKFFSLILAENPLFFPDFPDWKKSSKFSLNSLISLISGNPVFCISHFLPIQINKCLFFSMVSRHFWVLTLHTAASDENVHFVVFTNGALTNTLCKVMHAVENIFKLTVSSRCQSRFVNHFNYILCVSIRKLGSIGNNVI